MAIHLLTNTAGHNATALNMIQGSVDSGATLDLISGPRSTYWRTTAAATAEPGYLFSADVSATHFVIVRADWLLTVNNHRIRARNRDSSGVWFNMSGVDFNPLQASDLVGLKAQDLVIPVTPAHQRGYSVLLDKTSEVSQVSKFYASNSFQFDGILSMEPQPQWEVFPPAQMNFFTPQHAYYPFETEAKLTLNWTGCTRANVEAFKALPQILNWPLFVYDDAADLWPWKLEHVVIESWQESVINQNIHDISVTFQRLKLYE